MKNFKSIGLILVKISVLFLYILAIASLVQQLFSPEWDTFSYTSQLIKIGAIIFLIWNHSLADFKIPTKISRNDN